MLIPRFSLRQLLAITTASAIFCYLLAMAARGHQWAIATSLAISSVLCALLVYVAVFAVAWLLTMVGGMLTKQNVAASPFATAAPPPQFITPPEDQE
jgi:hypothetical protein